MEEKKTLNNQQHNYLSKEETDFRDKIVFIYFEDTAAGACGNAGGILIYVISNNEFVAFHTNYYDDAETHSMAECIIDNNINDFICCYGGLGNHAFLWLIQKEIRHLNTNNKMGLDMPIKEIW